ncbi:MAG: LPS export ABC transporter periplasmic protein LptC [Porphyromonadaceae bacterium]|nr:LPS export ABC transporter periplasmic protein LptC [Porphyromonadaceae bacterium]
MNSRHAPFAVSPIAAIVLLLGMTVALICPSCQKEKKSIVESFSDPKDISSLTTYDVNTLISDSGVTRYRIRAKEWRIYDKADEPYWYFPQGIYVEKFDHNFETESFILGDTAVYFSRLQIWRLRGDVRIENTQDEHFFTEELYWDQQKKTIYSDSAIHIERVDRIMEGVGFVSNETMTQYTLRHTTGIFPINQETRDNDEEARPESARSREDNAKKYAPRRRPST